MCEECHAESTDQYDGSSIAAKRTKATRSILRRHPELEVDPDSVIVKFTSKAEQRCLRLNCNPESTSFEIHIPAYGAVAMSNTPPLGQIAHLAWLESPHSYDEVCEILDVPARLRFGALFVSEHPPIDPPRADQADAVYDSEAATEDRE